MQLLQTSAAVSEACKAAEFRAARRRETQRKHRSGLREQHAAAMRALLLITAAWALAPITTPPKRTEFREGIGGATKEQAVAVGETIACAKKQIGPRDVVIRCYDQCINQSCRGAS